MAGPHPPTFIFVWVGSIALCPFPIISPALLFDLKYLQLYNYVATCTHSQLYSRIDLTPGCSCCHHHGLDSSMIIVSNMNVIHVK